MPLAAAHVEPAASLFVADFASLRRAVPVLPADLENTRLVVQNLEKMADRSLVALEDGKVVGYLAWWVIEHFRGTARRGVYVPEWAHSAIAGRRAVVYRALYRAAAEMWTAAGCGVHAITLLAGDAETRDAWFWNGFGMAVVDAVRSIEPLYPLMPTTLTIRAATTADADTLSALDTEHVQHYVTPPVFMPLPRADTSAQFRTFLEPPKNSIWLALDHITPVGFMRFTGHDFDAVAALKSGSAAFCNGAYVRPSYRGRGAGRALLAAALSHYAGLGLSGLYTNFESFNPEAASFWPRYFQPVCLSLMRVPEVIPGRDA